MQEVFSLWVWVRARLDRRDEAGFTAVEWLVIALGVIAIAGVAVVAVQSYVTSQSNQRSSP